MIYSNLVNDIFVSKIEIFIFFSLSDPSNLETLSEWVLLFSWQYSYLHKFNKNLFSLSQDTIGNTGYVTKVVTGTSYLRYHPAASEEWRFDFME